MSLIAANIFNPGMSTWLTNLIISSHNVVQKDVENLNWALEYAHGLSHEVYLVKRA